MKNKETLEEASVNFAHNYFEMHESNNYQALKLGFKAGARWQAERSYSEEDLYGFMDSYQNWLTFTNAKVLTFKEWFEQFKKPNTWYNEEQTNKRMNVIGQNGNDGTHYENK